MLTVLPFPAVSDVLLAKDMPGAVRSDLAAVRRATRLCCPVTALVSGMETEKGFAELIRRVGVNRAKVNRFGKGFNVWNPPTAERIDAFSAHACGAFEDWVYSLFRDPDGLTSRAMPSCTCCSAGSAAKSAAGSATSCCTATAATRRIPSADGQPLLFSGCYFAATGPTEDQQAFVKNVFEKMLDLEEELDWTEEAWARDDRCQTLAHVGWAVSSLLVLALIGTVAYRFWFMAK